jgi:hypothetical protein
MSELKTIKDLGYIDTFCIKCDNTTYEDGWCPECSNTPSVNIKKVIKEEDLRQIVIEWIKEFQKQRDIEERVLEGAYIDGQIDALMLIHDIEFQDLKTNIERFEETRNALMRAVHKKRNKIQDDTVAELIGLKEREIDRNKDIKEKEDGKGII